MHDHHPSPVDPPETNPGDPVPAPAQIIVTSDSPAVTLINTFTVSPERQLALVHALDAATAAIFIGADGFISANLHASLDGTRVINYAQWSSQQAYETAMARPEVREHIADSAALAESYDPRLVKVFATHTAEH
jgi:quinol monooxygenase YgiN